MYKAAPRSNVHPVTHVPGIAVAAKVHADKSCGRARPLATLMKKGLSLMAGQPESHKLRATGSKGKLRQRH
jgi:hypothetical protein